jgi:carbamoyltransferase
MRKRQRFYVGLAASFHDPALAIVDPAGKVVFAEAAERYFQSKRAFNCPPDPVPRVAELIETHCAAATELVIAVSWPKGYVYPMRVLTDLSDVAVRLFKTNLESDYTWPWPTAQAQLLALTATVTTAGYNLIGSRKIAPPATLRYYDHYLTHAACACYTSPFAEGACAVVDGHGLRGSCDFYRYRGGRLESVKSLVADGPDLGSLGHFYAIVCGLCGFDAMGGEEWKVMGLAAYGRFSRAWYQQLRQLVRVRGLSLVRPAGSSFLEVLDRLRRQARRPGEPALDYADLAFTGQQLFGELMAELLCNFFPRGGSDNLILGGGCALNSSWNGRITAATPFRRLHVPMAPGDDGNALGAALLAFFEDHPDARPPGRRQSPLLGSPLSARGLENWGRFNGGGGIEHLPDTLHERVAELLAAGKIVGWARGRAELGPRALGNRSILADPRPSWMRHAINSRVKLREEFRPLAPAILHEHGPEYFEAYEESPYMERALGFRTEVRGRVPAVVHVDGTGRLQSVRADLYPDFHKLLTAFHRRTGVPLLLNTSFNVMGKPIIHSVEDAVAVFHTSGLDVLVLEDHLAEKEPLAVEAGRPRPRRRPR